MESKANMTDYSKIDFTELKLEPIAGAVVSVTNNGSLMLRVDGLSVAKRTANGWVLQDGVATAGFGRARTDELWKRTEQVDEFIRQRSRRQITFLQLAQELVNNDRDVNVALGCTRATYRFNRDICAFEFHHGNGDWVRSNNMGRHYDTVIVFD